jgi:hypothetical protein
MAAMDDPDARTPMRSFFSEEQYREDRDRGGQIGGLGHWWIDELADSGSQDCASRREAVVRQAGGGGPGFRFR